MEQQYANIDAREVAHFSRLARTWWDQEGPFWPLHKLNELRRDYLRTHLAEAFGRNPHASEPFQGITVLDVGCGGGILSESMARLGADVHGVDVVEKNIEVARLHAHEAQLDVVYESASVGDLVQHGVEYDVVLNMEVVEHVPDPTRFLKDCCRLVHPGGVMAVATINRTLVAWLVAIIGAEYLLGWLPRGTHRFRRLVKPGEVIAALESQRFELTHRTGVRVNPINRHFSLTGGMAVNYMLLAKKIAGTGSGAG